MQWMSVLSKLMLVTIAFGALGVSAGDKVNCQSALSRAQCDRIEAVTALWQSPDLAAVPITVVERGELTSVEHGLEVDLAKTRALNEENEIGPCRYNAEESRVEVQKQVFQYSDENFERCIAAAYAQARYPEVEARWLKQLGVHEAWIVRDGELVRVNVPNVKKATLEPASARTLWASLATSELIRQRQYASVRAGRGLAAKDESAIADPVRQLLGLR